MFHAFLQGEDRTEFTIEVDATDADSARRKAEDRYPEAHVIEVFDPEVRAEEIHLRACRRMDDDDVYYDSDYD